MTTDLTVDADQLDAYLDRLGIGGRRDGPVRRLQPARPARPARPAQPARPAADLASLRALHRSHLHTVPFENLDIHLGRPISLDPGKLVDKLTRQHRGGFCYELNGAFAALLSGLGFEVTLLEARVYGGEEVGIRFDHLCLRVDLDQPYLVDVGFGGAFLEPLRLVPGLEQHDPGGRFTIRQDDEGRLQLAQDDWRRYRFDLTPRRLDEFAEACLYHQTSRRSHFTWNTVCSLARPGGGRVTVRGTSLIETTADDKRVVSEVTVDDLVTVYQDRFGIELTPAEVGRLVSSKRPANRPTEADAAT